MITNFAWGSGIGIPSDFLCGMPIPLGHCGQLTSPPRTGPDGRRLRKDSGTVIAGLGGRVAGVRVRVGVGVGVGVTDVGSAAAEDEGDGLGDLRDSGSSGAQAARSRAATARAEQRRARAITVPPPPSGATHRRTPAKAG
jgi:hypothetical protein